MSNSRLILRHGWIDIVRPSGDAAAQVDEPTREARAFERLDGFGAAHAALTMHHRLAARIDLVYAPHDLTERDQPRPFEFRNLALVRFAHVNDLQVVAPIEALLEFGRGDLFHLSLLLLLCGCGDDGSQPAERFVVNQLFDRRTGPAHRTIRVFP